jgi:hypothetical protein
LVAVPHAKALPLFLEPLWRGNALFDAVLDQFAGLAGRLDILSRYSTVACRASRLLERVRSGFFATQTWSVSGKYNSSTLRLMARILAAMVLLWSSKSSSVPHMISMGGVAGER